MRNVPAAMVDYDRDQIRRDLNSLRRNMHELCTRSTTGFDCSRFLDGTDKPTQPIIVKTATVAGQQSSLVCDKV